MNTSGSGVSWTLSSGDASIGKVAAYGLRNVAYHLFSIIQENTIGAFTVGVSR